MYPGSALFLIALGAILRFAVTFHVAGVNIHVIGTILIIIGVVGLVLWMIWMATNSTRRTAVVERDPVVHERDVY